MTDLELYNTAKEAYYNGEPLMTDYEFDELEKKLGLENKSYVGSKHNPSYTIKHPYIMGSLSKVQIKEKDGLIDWEMFTREIQKFILRNNAGSVIITPKYDGCSFELYFNHGQITTSTRGDGEYGKDISKHLHRKFDKSHKLDFDEYTLRGEVLINKDTFAKKYSSFVNPRSFVSGLLNRDYCEDADFQSMIDDLSIVIYDIRIKLDGRWIDCDWTRFNINHRPEFHLFSPAQFNLEAIYNSFNKYRQHCKFALDGIVIKPVESQRINNTTDARPKDCVAIKFAPMLQETEVVDIEWTLAKNYELHPVIITNPVMMDGKTITRASAHNYGYLIDNQLSIGSKVILSLAGDIIPFIYKITDTRGYDESKLNLPVGQQRIEGCHLYKVLSKEEDDQHRFIESARALNIPGIGPANAETIFTYMVEQCKGNSFLGVEETSVPVNILECSGMDVYNALTGAIGAKVKKSFEGFVKNITLSDIILSCNFTSCGDRVSEEVAKYLTGQDYSFEHLAEKAYSWCLNENSDELQYVYKLIRQLGKQISDFVTEPEYKDPQIPIIMTGSPTTCETKGEFLRLHPEYRVTSSWKEVQIVFTGDLNSTSSKMQNAKKKGIEIRLY